MFPQFDKLLESDFDQISGLLSDADVCPADETATNLIQIADIVRSSDSYRPEQPVAQWYETLKRVVKEAPLPHTVTQAIEHFLRASPTVEDALQLFEDTPRSLEVLGRLACGSAFLTRILLNQPSALRKLTTERRTAEMKAREEFLNEALQSIAGASTVTERLNGLRQYQRLEILRIGMCDAFGLLDLKFVTLQISLLADAMVAICLQIATEEAGLSEVPVSVIALGKHGGEELNYSSDIDLVLVADELTAPAQRVARRLIDALSDTLSSGFLYRVDMRLRPWGDAGPLVNTPASYEQYLQTDAQLWEKQALLKARVVAGDPGPGAQLLKRLPVVIFAVSEDEVYDSVRHMKGEIEDRLRQVGKLNSEVKLGAGSIRDIEFLVQALQLVHGGREPRLASPNTLDALMRLAEFHVLNSTEYRELREGYIFLRTIEHALQLSHNQQTHELPADIQQQRWLARRLDYPSESELMARFEDHRRAVRSIFDRYFHATADRRSTDDDVSKNVKGSVARSAVRTDGAAVHLQQFFATQASDYDELRRQLETGITREQRCRVHCARIAGDDTRAVVTVVCAETPELLAMICGLLFEQRLDIREAAATTGPRANKFGQDVSAGDFLGVFLVEHTALMSIDHDRTALTVEAALHRMVTDCQSGDRDSVRRNLVEIFCDRIGTVPESQSAQAELTMHVAEVSPDNTTQLEITADDSFGFFFELSNALALCGFRICSAELGTSAGRIFDVLQVTDADGQAVTDPLRLEELRTTVTLIKQFTHWLPSNSDPLNALLRFRDLLQKLLFQSQWEKNVATLQQPTVLRAVSRVLGLSRYLWESFLQARSRDLLKLLQDAHELQRRVTRQQLQDELNEAMNEATDDQTARTLNRFKDRHLFRIDLRHVFGHCEAFNAFAQEITELAEVVIEAAVAATLKRLVSQHGQQTRADGTACRFTMAALGKFGGVEMGFASDIEIFLVFEDDWGTISNGTVGDDAERLAGRVAAAGFYERLMLDVSQMIEARHKGVFEIDLRMRPYGQAGSAAVSLRTFEKYFGTGGDAWPYERQSLVKLRCVGGDESFAKEVLACRDRLVYSEQKFDFDAMRAMREKQVRQLVRGGTVNAKLSDGGLVDCEYAVQALQLTFGHRLDSLRMSNTFEALNAVRDAGLLAEAEVALVQEAYVFLRQVIDCLRMVRGNALDLTVPPQDSSDYQQLAKRLNTVHEASLPLTELENQMANVRAFAKRVEEVCSDVHEAVNRPL